MRLCAVAAFAAALTTPFVYAQGPNEANAGACTGARQTAIAGTVRDSTLALIPGATVSLDGKRTTVSGADGRYRFACVAGGAHQVSAMADGFAGIAISVAAPHAGEVQLLLQPASVETNVTVNADDGNVADPEAVGGAATISGKQLQSLADDPDDLLRELQQLGAATGGNPANTTIAVNGFQGSSKLPPKSSIAYIKVNPDVFSAEFREPPFGGGRVEVYTKPGQTAFHGALFGTNGSPWENARDPFSTSKAAIGKQRYGFELNGPIRKQGSDFALTLEHRSIDNFGVVNAVTLDPSGNPVSTVANVPTPQRLWVGEARVDWQLGAKNTFIASYDANVNSLLNVGVGGTSLAETGYTSGQYEHALKFVDVTTVSTHLMHEAHVGLRWDGENDLPNSAAPQVQVAGSFTGGGATIGPQQLHELDLEVDDDAILTTRNHTLKFGTQLRIEGERQQLTTNFNGTYDFGGGTAPVLDANGNAVSGQTETISGLEQYRRTTLGLVAVAPTAFSNVVGTPAVNFTQVRDALFVQDDWKLSHGFQISAGLRYLLISEPLVTNGVTPRLGVLWSPTKKGTWTLHAHEGLFTGFYQEADYAEVLREDGVHRVTSTVYDPTSYSDPLTGGTIIHSAREFSPHLSLSTWEAYDFGGSYSLPKGWNVTADYIGGRMWNNPRSLNVNAPLNGDPTGPRLLGIPNTDLLQVQNSGQGKVRAELLFLEQHSIKNLQLFFGTVHLELVDDDDDNTFFTPQSTFTNAGEFAPRDTQPNWQMFGNASYTFPEKIALSADYHGAGDQHYNITTGFDNNGDGDFNDRPQYAAPGTAGAVATRFGLLTASGGTGVLPRDKGVMPWQYYLDMNVERAFTVTRNPKADHQQVVTVNLRSSNVLNHTNVTQVGGVLGSPLFAVPYAADNGRRVEAGLRYSF